MLVLETAKILDWKKMYWKAGKGYFAVGTLDIYIHGTFRIHSKYIHTNQSQFACELSSCNVKNVLKVS